MVNLILQTAGLSGAAPHGIQKARQNQVWQAYPYCRLFDCIEKQNVPFVAKLFRIECQRVLATHRVLLLHRVQTIQQQKLKAEPAH